jgi:twitching motility protein PilT
MSAPGPDVILIGEMRDVETVQTAVAAAQTGHLVLSTLHTIDAQQTVERIINFFRPICTRKFAWNSR